MANGKREVVKPMNAPLHILVAMGTRPEVIKLYPVIRTLRADPRFRVTVCATAQHRHLLDQAMAVFGLAAEIDLDLMQEAQSLSELTGRVVHRFGDVMDRVKPDRVMVQGDTTTAMAAAMAAFYRHVPVDHVEAGLRTGDMRSPFPEEFNRRVAALITDLHFAPTQRSADALLAEGVPSSGVFMTGNTVIDALLLTRDAITGNEPEIAPLAAILPGKTSGKRIILVTAHRRENHDGGMDRIADALARIAARRDVEIVFPVHPNPKVRAVMDARIKGAANIHLIAPLDYRAFVWLMDRADFILSDSGGVQEEAPALGKPVIVMRDTTERAEAVEAGVAILAGTDPARLEALAHRLLDDAAFKASMVKSVSPFGDGKASARIAEALSRRAGHA